jgi:hypothetical protein
MKTDVSEQLMLQEMYTQAGVDMQYWENMDNAPSDIQMELLDYLENVEMLQWLVKPAEERGYARDRPRDDKGRIIVDIIRPHILEDMDYFRQAGLHFQKHGKYTNLYPNPHPKSEYRKFWDEETRRCIEGYVRESDGEWVSGYYYFYLNYFPIMRTEATGEGKRAERVYDLPDVFDSDYLFFHYVEQGEAESEYGAVLKTRGRGYSYKVASMFARNFFLIKKSKSFAFASETEYLTKDGILNKTWDGFEYLDKHTAWKKIRKVKNTTSHKKASYLDAEGKEKGYKSEVIEVTTKGNPEKGRGKRGKLLAHEEGGIYPGLLQTWNIARPSIEDGDFTFGYQIVFGTGGCLTAGNLIFTNDGNLIDIKNLSKSKGILGFDKNTKNISKESISYDIIPVNKECIKLTTNMGRTIECSIDHPIYTTIPSKNSRLNTYTFKNAGDFRIGNYISVVDKVDIFGNNKMWNPRLVGLLIGDGSYGYNQSVRLSNCGKEVLDYAKNNFDTIVNKTYKTKNDQIYEEIGIRKIRPELRKLGIINQTKNNKTLPVNVHTYCKKDLQELIAGFYDADGYVNIRKNKNRNTPIAEITLSSSSKNLLEEVRFVLLKFGVHGRVRERKPRLNKKGPIKDKNSWYEFTISDRDSLLEFANNFTLLPKHKQEILDKIKKVYINVKSHRLEKNTRLEKIVNVEYVGEKEVYRLSTDVTNTYLANGIITHNTPGSKFAGLEELFYKGGGYKVKMLRNVWDKIKGEGTCGYFVPEYMNRKGCYDQNGNSNVIKAMQEVLLGRKKIRENATKENALTQEKAERPLTPQEAVMRIEGSLFPIDELKSHLESVMPQLSKFVSIHYIGKLQLNSGGILEYLPSADDKVIREFPLKDNINRIGAIEMFELPQKDGMGNIPRFRYYAGIDTYDDDSSTTNSLGSIFIADILTDRIVAEYTGRPKTANEFYETCMRMLRFYNAIANYENDKKGLFAYFTHRNALSLLADNPQILKDMELVKATNLYGNKSKGTNSGVKINAWGRRLQADWMLEPAYDEAKSGLLNLHKIRSVGYLKEAIGWNEDGNFDRVSAMGMLMILREEYKKYKLQVSENMLGNKINNLSVDPFFTNNYNNKAGIASNVRQVIMENSYNDLSKYEI